MQLTVADPAVDHIDLVLEAWSAAQPAQDSPSAADNASAADLDTVEPQLSLRLVESQIPLWDARR